MEIATKNGQATRADRVLEALSTLAALLDRTIKEVKDLDSDFQVRLLHALQASPESEAERERLNRELERAAQAAAQWEAERARLNAEIERAQNAAAEALAEAEVQKAKAAAPAPVSGPISIEAIAEELKRVEDLVKQISAIIEDPASDLSTVIRKNVERAELESYLRGIRYALSGGKPK